MKRVVLIGDSIRLGYQRYVKARLGRWAEVIAPEESCGSSRDVLAHLDTWAIDLYPQVAHVNCGLHDIRREFDAEENAVPLAEYEENVRAILQRLKRETKAQVIWATITPVLERWHRDNNKFDRLEKDLIAYNIAAARIAEELHVPIDNLYGMLVEADLGQILLFDGVHYKEEGYSLMGRTVAEFILPFL
jgi:lysophospholipase L1-like esterase